MGRGKGFCEPVQGPSDVQGVVECPGVGGGLWRVMEGVCSLVNTCKGFEKNGERCAVLGWLSTIVPGAKVKYGTLQHRYS